jgi:hypothetical protein
MGPGIRLCSIMDVFLSTTYQEIRKARKSFTRKIVYDTIKRQKYTYKRGFAHGSVMETAPDCVD